MRCEARDYCVQKESLTFDPRNIEIQGYSQRSQGIKTNYGWTYKCVGICIPEPEIVDFRHRHSIDGCYFLLNVIMVHLIVISKSYY
jgi:hypothetical protein